MYFSLVMGKLWLDLQYAPRFEVRGLLEGGAY